MTRYTTETVIEVVEDEFNRIVETIDGYDIEDRFPDLAGLDSEAEFFAMAAHRIEEDAGPGMIANVVERRVPFIPSRNYDDFTPYGMGCDGPGT